jgi:ankyrin repeat protein
METSSLVEAIKARDLFQAKFLMDQGAAINQRDLHLKTPLICAAETGQLEAVQCLVAHGADIDAAQYPPDHGTPLEYAITAGQAEVTDFLLSAGAAVPPRMLNYAAHAGRVEILNRLLDHGITATGINPDRSNALHALCVFGPNHIRPIPPADLWQAMKRLITGGADINAIDALGNTPLLMAASSGNVFLTERLLAHGADPNLTVNTRSPLNQAPTLDTARVLLTAKIREPLRAEAVHRFTMIQHYSIAKLIADTLPEAQKKPIQRGIALLEMVQQRDLSGVAQLLKDGPLRSGPSDFTGIGLLRAAQLYPAADRRAMTALLLAADSNPNAEVYGQTPLIAAVTARDRNLCLQLLHGGADPNFHVLNGDTALMAALGGSGDLYDERKSPATRFDSCTDELVKILIAAGANVNEPGYEGRTPLLCAIEKFPFNLERLFSAGADVNQPMNTGYTPLMMANTEIAERLLTLGANPRSATLQGLTALHLCRDLSKADLLLKHGADPNTPDSNGWTPLMTHAFAGHLPLVERLLPVTTNLEAADSQGQTAWLLAAIAGQETVSGFLRKHGAIARPRKIV